MKPWLDSLHLVDDRRDIAIPGNKQATLLFCADHFVSIANQSIAERGAFNVALSGGSTPKAMYDLLATTKFKDKIDWTHVHLFWSDERTVSPDSLDSNYHMAMSSGLGTLPLLPANIHRMEAESLDIAEAALEYQKLIKSQVSQCSFDLVMLGMGDDGHTASLFPKTHGLHVSGRWVIANYIERMKCWRMTFTFDLINAARHIAVYVIGANKADMLNKVLMGPYIPDELPSQRVGTKVHKALWIADRDAVALYNPSKI